MPRHDAVLRFGCLAVLAGLIALVTLPTVSALPCKDQESIPRHCHSCDTSYYLDNEPHAHVYIDDDHHGGYGAGATVCWSGFRQHVGASNDEPDGGAQVDALTSIAGSERRAETASQGNV